jgi:hypothetical protein
MNLFIIVKNWIKKEIPKPLGRWSNECIKKTNHKIDWANEDHCGPCGQYLKSINKPPKL